MLRAALRRRTIEARSLEERRTAERVRERRLGATAALRRVLLPASDPVEVLRALYAWRLAALVASASGRAEKLSLARTRAGSAASPVPARKERGGGGAGEHAPSALERAVHGAARQRLHAALRGWLRAPAAASPVDRRTRGASPARVRVLLKNAFKRAGRRQLALVLILLARHVEARRDGRLEGARLLGEALARFAARDALILLARHAWAACGAARGEVHGVRQSRLRALRRWAAAAAVSAAAISAHRPLGVVRALHRWRALCAREAGRLRALAQTRSRPSARRSSRRALLVWRARSQYAAAARHLSAQRPLAAARRRKLLPAVRRWAAHSAGRGLGARALARVARDRQRSALRVWRDVYALRRHRERAATSAALHVAELEAAEAEAAVRLSKLTDQSATVLQLQAKVNAQEAQLATLSKWCRMQRDSMLRHQLPLLRSHLPHLVGEAHTRDLEQLLRGLGAGGE
ncbi:hypothetical protein T492DRAFT_1071775 [Pavlovales sp. CCMP2436]|nr:hypothetical protein T492DRAFT_1071775 [Pavlovales sp. CCMP2436]